MRFQNSRASSGSNATVESGQLRPVRIGVCGERAQRVAHRVDRAERGGIARLACDAENAVLDQRTGAPLGRCRTMPRISPKRPPCIIVLVGGAVREPRPDLRRIVFEVARAAWPWCRGPARSARYRPRDAASSKVGSISKLCWSTAAQRRVASVGASPDEETIAGGPSAAAGSTVPIVPRGGWRTSHSTAW